MTKDELVQKTMQALVTMAVERGQLNTTWAEDVVTLAINQAYQLGQDSIDCGFDVVCPMA